MSDSGDDDDGAAPLAFVDPAQQAAETAAAEAIAAAELQEEEEERETKKRKRKAPPKNAPLDEDGLPMEWDADEGAWVKSVGFTAAPEALTEQWMQTRLSQTGMHLDKLRSGGGVHGTCLLTSDEVAEGREVLNYALAGVMRDASTAKGLKTASAVFWAIALAQSAAARRSGGWVVDSEDAVEVWDMDRLHDFLSNFKSEVNKVDESGGNNGTGPATKVGQAKGRGGGGRGRGKGGASFKGAGGGGEEATKRRRLRMDNLGDDHARREKLAALDALIRTAGGAGLAEPVLHMRPPQVRTLLKASASELAAAANLPGSSANPGGRGSARAARIAKWGGHAVSMTHQKVGVQAAVLKARGSELDDLEDDLDGEIASQAKKEVKVEAIVEPPPVAQEGGAGDDDLLDMLGE